MQILNNFTERVMKSNPNKNYMFFLSNENYNKLT